MRARLVRPEFWSDSKVAPMADSVRLFYIGLWCIADDAGYFEVDLQSIGMILLAGRRPDQRIKTGEAALRVLVDAGRVQLLACGIHGLIPTIPRHRVQGGNQSFATQKVHQEDCTDQSVPVRTRPDRPSSKRESKSESVPVRTSPSMYVSESESESESVSGSKGDRRTAALGSRDPSRPKREARPLSEIVPEMAARFGSRKADA